jgi:uncharacterized membrane protein (DUF485 family)
MLHEPAARTGKDPAFSYKRRLGVIMFLVYAVVYAGFVLVNLVKPGLMGWIALAGLNVAVLYGFGLIVFALILALIYNSACSRREAEMTESQKEGR